MQLWLTDRVRLGLLLSACVFLASIEVLVPLFQYRRGRLRRAFPNVVLGSSVVLANLALASGMASLSTFVVRKRVGLLSNLQSHRWLLVVGGIMGLDLFAYIAHYLLHKMALAWKFHAVHHSEFEVDVTTAFRQHPGETLWRAFWQGLGIAALGLPFWIVPFYVSLSSLNALLEHANLRVDDRLDRWLRLLVVTPDMHKVHHSRLIEETDSNYANIFSFWDRIFGTYTAGVNYGDLRYGLDGFDQKEKQALIALLCHPLHVGRTVSSPPQPPRRSP